MKLTDEQLNELSEIGEKYIYTGIKNERHLTWSGVSEIIKRYEKMKYEYQLEQSELNLKTQTLTSLWGLMKDRTCTNSCSVVCGECQLPTQEALYTEEQVIDFLQLRLMFFGIATTDSENEKWLKQFKK